MLGSNFHPILLQKSMGTRKMKLLYFRDHAEFCSFYIKDGLADRLTNEQGRLLLGNKMCIRGKGERGVRGHFCMFGI